MVRPLVELKPELTLPLVDAAAVEAVIDEVALEVEAAVVVEAVSEALDARLAEATVFELSSTKYGV